MEKFSQQNLLRITILKFQLNWRNPSQNIFLQIKGKNNSFWQNGLWTYSNRKFITWIKIQIPLKQTEFYVTPHLHLVQFSFTFQTLNSFIFQLFN